jgi:putative membrane protein
MMPFFFMVLMFIFIAAASRRARAWRWGSGNRAAWMPFGCWSPGQDPQSPDWSRTARQILDQRYAGGEITREEYEQMKRDLEPEA